MRLLGKKAFSAALVLGALCAGGMTCAAPLTRNLIPTYASPQHDVIYTSTRQINSLTVTPNGTLWAATSGGILECDTRGTCRKWTRRDGLPSHEIQRIGVADNLVTAQTPLGRATYQNGKWHSEKSHTADVVSSTRKLGGETKKSQNAPAKNAPAKSVANAPEISVMWRGRQVTARIDGLHIGDGRMTRAMDLPPSRGSHISALLPRGDALWVALFGDGLWQYDNKKWTAIDVDLPTAARDITALAEDVKRSILWVGTRRDGIWRFAEKTKRWTQHLQPDEPFDHNIQNLAIFGSQLWLSTLEDGAVTNATVGWARATPPQMSSVAPRHMVQFRGAFYVRNGDGKVDCYDGRTWARDVFKALPRRKVTALVVDGAHLYAAQWGGWSEWDGARWTHFLQIPELQGLPPMSLLPDGDTLWIGTQSRGLFEYSKRTQKLRLHDERLGLPDDWITCLARIGDTVYAGTFVGGLAFYVIDKEAAPKWVSLSQLHGENVTALADDRRGGVFAATRHGMWHKTADGGVKKVAGDFALDEEAQALCVVPQGLWIGTRTGLFFVTNATIAASSATRAGVTQGGKS